MTAPEIVFAWHGIPPYAAECLAALLRQHGDIKILATRSTVPHTDIDALLPDIAWLECGRTYTWKMLKLSPPDVFIHTGWAYPEFNSLAKRLNPTSKRIMLIDNNWKNNVRQWVGSLWFRLRQYSNIIYGAWVPGKSAALFCRKLGIAERNIFTGLYGANPNVFPPGKPLHLRPKKILFVGSFIPRKGIDAIVKAIPQVLDKTWEFVFVGQGPGKCMLEALPNTRILDFAPPHVIAEYMRESRFLLLPSLEEHWGVVVHEACCSGCGLLLSNKVGAAPDLLGATNGVSFKPNAGDLEAAINTITKWTDRDYNLCYQESISKAEQFGLSVFCQSFQNILDSCKAH